MRPCDIRFTQDSIPYYYSCNDKNLNCRDEKSLAELAMQLAGDEMLKHMVCVLRVVVLDEKPTTYYTLDNRRLAVFRLLQMAGKVDNVKVKVLRLGSLIEDGAAALAANTARTEYKRKLDTSSDGLLAKVRVAGLAGDKGWGIGISKDMTTFPFEHVALVKPKIENSGHLFASEKAFSTFLAAFDDDEE